MGRRLARGRRLPWTVALAALVGAGAVAGILLATEGGSGRSPSNAPLTTAPAAAIGAGLPADVVRLRDQVASSGHLPTGGMTITVAIPAAATDFDARDALVYLPPVWFKTPQPELPVVMLLAGEPSAPSDWVDSGDAADTADRFAAAHAGVAPIVVMPDDTGSDEGDTECVDSARFGNVEDYLIDDVPSWARSVLGAATGPRSLAIAGYSAGGTCSVVLALRHPDAVAAFASYSGYATPTYKNDDVEMSIPILFDGSEQDYLAHDPLTLLSQQQYPDLSGWFEGGEQDEVTVAAARRLQPAASAAGVATCIGFIAGGHDFAVWSQCWADSLPWLSAQLGLTPPSAPTHVTCSAGQSS